MTIDFTNSAGKGAQPRPFSDYEQYKTNWDLIFNKKVQSQEETTPNEDNSTYENQSS